MGLLGAASEKAQFELLPVREYIWTLWDMTSETGQYGEQVKWVWLISNPETPDEYICKNDGNEREIWQFTKPSLAKGSRARSWAEALMGRELRNGEEPDDTDLIRHRMVGMLVHKPNKSDPTIKREAISDEIPCRPYRPARPVGAGTVSANPTLVEVETELVKSDELRAWCKKLIRNAALSDVEGRWSDLEPADLKRMSDDEIAKLGAEVEAAIRKAAA